jgi:hypothetical protein
MVVVFSLVEPYKLARGKSRKILQRVGTRIKEPSPKADIVKRT